MHYTGTSIAGKDYDVYRCTGNRHRGNERLKERCGCAQVNAQKLESRVWQDVVGLLANPEKLQELAKEWLQISGSDSDSSNTELHRIENQEAKLLRAIALVQDDYYLAEVAEQEQLQRRIEKYRSDLGEIAKRKSLLDAYRADVNLQNKQLESLAELAGRAQHRLATLNLAEQREVFELLGIKVVFSRVEESEPVTITIYGHIDERIGQSTHIGPNPDHADIYPEVPFVLGSNA